VQVLHEQEAMLELCAALAPAEVCALLDRLGVLVDVDEVAPSMLAPSFELTQCRARLAGR